MQGIHHQYKYAFSQLFLYTLENKDKWASSVTIWREDESIDQQHQSDCFSQFIPLLTKLPDVNGVRMKDCPEGSQS